MSLFALLALPTFAAVITPCNLEITLTCASGKCSSTTINHDTNVCSGTVFVAVFTEQTNATVSGFTNTLGLPECFDSSEFPSEEPTGAFAFCFGDASIAPGASFTTTATINTSGGTIPPDIPVIAFTAVEDADGNELAFVSAVNNVVLPTCTPIANVTPVTLTGIGYDVSWSEVSQAGATYIVEESTAADFSTITGTQTTSALAARFSHTVTQNTTYYYRVHAQQCGGAPGPLSAPVSIVVQTVPPAGPRGTDAIVPFGTTAPVNIPLQVTLNVAGKHALDGTFTAKSDKPFATVTPASGAVPASGSVDLTVTASPASLPPGANTATVTVTTNTGQTTNVPVSISLVTPVSPSGKTIPPGNALIIPVVTHVVGSGGPFQSDVRLTNTSAGQVKYQITYTPRGTDGTVTSKSTTVPVDPGSTVALNDIVKDFFGIGASGVAGDAGAGALEIRPLNNSTTLTYASSRTYVTTDKGTLGQFIAALPFTSFATNALNLIPIPGQTPPTGPPSFSLQQIANSAKFRTNIGLVEGSGTPASLRLRVFDDHGTMLNETPFTLQPGELRTLSASEAGIPTLEDGRLEIIVDSPTGAVSGYASVLDNVTQDPLAVMPAQPALMQASRFVLPGMAELVSPFTNFHSDVRVFNGGDGSVTVTPVFYPQNNGTPVPGTPFTLGVREVKAIDNVLPTLFNTAGGGSIVFTTTAPANLVTTGRTYTNSDDGGTFGQFIPGVAPAQGIGAGDRPLQILQLEESQNFRSNLGLAELTGNPAHVRMTAVIPDAKITASTEFDLAPNEFRQFGSVLSQFGLNQGNANIYNARISVQVVSGAGRITAYGSVIDNFSKDPTYVPAQ